MHMHGVEQRMECMSRNKAKEQVDQNGVLQSVSRTGRQVVKLAASSVPLHALTAYN